MSKKIIQEQIMTLLEDIANQTNIVSAYEEQIPQIELDIIMSNIRKMYVTYKKLNTLNFSSPSNEETLPPVMEKEPEKIIETTQKEELVEDIKKPEIQNEETFVENIIKEKEEVETTSQQREQTSLFEEKKTIGDKYKENNKEASINESIKTNQEDVSIGSQMQNNTITDIRTVIGLNEKFLFINELFKGNHDAFATHINNLNNCENVEEAKAYVENLSQEYDWGIENNAKEKFNQIVERKFV
jgi:hypothetical protein